MWLTGIQNWRENTTNEAIALTAGGIPIGFF